MISHEHGPQLTQAECAGGCAQRRAVQEDAQARRGGCSGCGIGGHGAEHALEDNGPLQLERQARGGRLAAKHRGHAGALQAGQLMDYSLGHLRRDRRMSGPWRFQLPLTTPLRPLRAHLSVPEARL